MAVEPRDLGPQHLEGEPERDRRRFERRSKRVRIEQITMADFHVFGIQIRGFAASPYHAPHRPAPLRRVIGQMRTKKSRCARYQDHAIRCQLFSSRSICQLKIA